MLSYNILAHKGMHTLTCTWDNLFLACVLTCHIDIMKNTITHRNLIWTSKRKSSSRKPWAGVLVSALSSYMYGHRFNPNPVWFLKRRLDMDPNWNKPKSSRLETMWDLGITKRLTRSYFIQEVTGSISAIPTESLV